MVRSSTLLDRALGSIGGTEEFQRKSKQYGDSLSFVEEHRDELLKKYNENWIAIYKSKVIAHAKKFEELMQKISSTKLPIGEILVEFMSSRKVLTLYYI